MYEEADYCGKINYTTKKSKQTQIQTLISYAKQNKKLPFYMFYAIPNKTTKTLCQSGVCTQKENKECCCLFLSDAYEVQKIANKCITSKSKVFKNNILAVSNPFTCLFCCPLVHDQGDGMLEYFRHYYKNETFENCIVQTENLPKYVQLILEQKDSIKEEHNPMQGMIETFELHKINNIAVLRFNDFKL